MDDRPVLYLDLDDTLVSWAGGTPHAAPGARDFMLWALHRFEVRWLTTWCPGGVMNEQLLGDLAEMLCIPADVLGGIRGFAWDSGESKLNGIAWLEHLVLRRPFVWLEDDNSFGEREHAFLAHHHLLGCYRHCNVTEKPESLGRTHASLRRWLEEVAAAA